MTGSILTTVIAIMALINLEATAWLSRFDFFDRYVWRPASETVAGAARGIGAVAARGAAAGEDSGRLPRAENKKNPVRSAAADFDLLRADSGAVIDGGTGTILYGKNADKQLPIASITKLITALVFLDRNPGWEKSYEIKASDRREGSKAFVSVGDRVKIKDLFYLSLVASANTETIALVGASGLEQAAFVAEMNKKAKELGLVRTLLKDPVGLDNDNLSTPLEVARLVKAAFSNDDIRRATLTKKHEFTTLSGKLVKVSNTDSLLGSFLSENADGIKIVGGKTGYTEEAGGCFAGKFTDRAGHEIISVVLGSPDKESRFEETKNLVEWVYKNYRWQ